MEDGTGKAGEQQRGKLAREERLAARLRENLRRRKAQARALGGRTDAQCEDEEARTAAAPDPLPKRPEGR